MGAQHSYVSFFFFFPLYMYFLNIPIFFLSYNFLYLEKVPYVKISVHADPSFLVKRVQFLINKYYYYYIIVVYMILLYILYYRLSVLLLKADCSLFAYYTEM